jgi:hypothetical protein
LTQHFSGQGTNDFSKAATTIHFVLPLLQFIFIQWTFLNGPPVEEDKAYVLVHVNACPTLPISSCRAAKNAPKMSAWTATAIGGVAPLLPIPSGQDGRQLHQHRR